MIEHKVVYKVAIVIERLRPHAGRSASHIILVNVRDELLQFAHLQRNQGRSGNFHHSRADELRCHFDQSREAQRIDKLWQVDVRPLVALAAERQHRVRPEPHAAVHPRSKMHAQEGEPWIGNGINVAANHMALVRIEQQVLPAERDDLRHRRAAGHFGQLVRLQASAGENVPSAYLIALLTTHRNRIVQVIRGFGELAHLKVHVNVSSRGLEVTRIILGHKAPIDDALSLSHTHSHSLRVLIVFFSFDFVTLFFFFICDL
uniref:Uncharacterized protein n=1 Tax=Anopheles atroparvus TaxID=41427 RepID=A0A182JMT9_ANOAO